MLFAPVSTKPEQCLACGYIRSGVAESARCPECGSLPLQAVRPSQSQSSFIVTSRLIFGVLLLGLTALGPTLFSPPGAVRAAFAFVALASLWSWPQLWLSHPCALRAKARPRFGLAAGIAAALLLSGALVPWVAEPILGLEPASPLRGVVTGCFMTAAAVVGWTVGRWRASRLLTYASARH